MLSLLYEWGILTRGISAAPKAFSLMKGVGNPVGWQNLAKFGATPTGGLVLSMGAFETAPRLAGAIQQGIGYKSPEQLAAEKTGKEITDFQDVSTKVITQQHNDINALKQQNQDLQDQISALGDSSFGDYALPLGIGALGLAAGGAGISYFNNKRRFNNVQM